MPLINEETIKELRDYLKLKTGRYYFKDIRQTPDNIQLTCPFHKDGQENKPSANIRITDGPNTFVGNFNCFTCKRSMSINTMVKQILGSFYDEDEVEAKFQFKTIQAQADIESKYKHVDLFSIPEEQNNVSESQLREYRYYCSYLQDRRINEETANKYDIGYDKYSNHITFPIRDKYRNCLGLGRRAITEKKYIYPFNFIKPLYGVYELPELYSNIWVVEGPFNLWSLSQWGKNGVALLGTGTKKQLEELLALKPSKYILALDPDEARNEWNKKNNRISNK